MSTSNSLPMFKEQRAEAAVKQRVGAPAEQRAAAPVG